MFKENKAFWFYFLGIVILFFVLFSIMRRGFEDNNFLFSSFPFNLVTSKGDVFPKPKGKLDITKDYFAIIETNLGNFKINLFEENAPNTVASFINLVNNHYYDGTKFYRLKKGFLIQGGSRNTSNSDPSDDKFGGPGYTTPDEINWDSLDFNRELRDELGAAGYKSAYGVASKPLEKYSVAMASTGKPDTLGGQFFILYAEENDPRIRNLEGRHTVFAKVIDGFEVVDSFNIVPVDNPALESPRPLKTIMIKNVVISSR